MCAGCKPKRTQAQLGYARGGGECHTYGHIRHEKEAAVVWTREKARRARDQATSAQHDSARERPRERSRLRFMDTIRMYRRVHGMNEKDVQDRGSGAWSGYVLLRVWHAKVRMCIRLIYSKLCLLRICNQQTICICIIKRFTRNTEHLMNIRKHGEQCLYVLSSERHFLRAFFEFQC